MVNKKAFIALVVFLVPVVISLDDAITLDDLQKDEPAHIPNILQQLDRLTANTEILKLRLELNAEKEQHHRSHVEGKIHHLEEIIILLVEQQRKDSNVLIQLSLAQAQAGLLTRDEEATLISEFRQVSAQQEVILKKLDIQRNDDANKVDGAKQCVNTITTGFEDLRNTLTTLVGKLSNQIGQLLKLAVDHEKSEVQDLDKKGHDQLCELTGKKTMLCGTLYEKYPTCCADNKTTHCSADQCLITNSLIGTDPFNVTCDGVSDGGGWLVIQRRINGSVDFYRNWREYKNGFGDLNGEFWLGLDKLHALTTTLAPVELLVQLTDHKNVTKYAKYKEFLVGSEAELYKLKQVDGYQGNAGDSLRQHKGFNFSTMDNDNDDVINENCAEYRKGAWWYYSCYSSNLNGIYYNTGKSKDANGISWGGFYGYYYSLKSAKMMIRPLRGISN